jgi:hypothetical protein
MLTIRTNDARIHIIGKDATVEKSGGGMCEEYKAKEN